MNFHDPIENVLNKGEVKSIRNRACRKALVNTDVCKIPSKYGLPMPMKKERKYM